MISDEKYIARDFARHSLRNVKSAIHFICPLGGLRSLLILDWRKGHVPKDNVYGLHAL